MTFSCSTPLILNHALSAFFDSAAYGVHLKYLQHTAGLSNTGPMCHFNSSQWGQSVPISKSMRLFLRTEYPDFHIEFQTTNGTIVMSCFYVEGAT